MNGTGRIYRNHIKIEYERLIITIWRAVSDLNIIMLYVDKNGEMPNMIQRKIISIGDMIVCNEGEGFVGLSSKPLGAVDVIDRGLEIL